MDMTGEYRVPAPRETVWQALNDVEVLRQSIPGCDEIEKTSDTSFSAKVTAKVGPVKAKFSGAVTLSDIDPPNGYTISGEGTGGAAGFAKGGAQVTLEDDGDGTLLKYTVNATVGGKLAQIGSRLIDSTSKKMANEFFGKFVEVVGSAEAAPESDAVQSPPPADSTASAPDETDASKGLPPALWVVLVIVIVAGLIFAFQG
ncbi:MAG: carbon monoxide dehydrogenase subunit G [Alphaproteobacteria bacterium]|nr:carbon monoxide dehydrogenase subunit G [Alphaproteobacteria bacterium]